MMGAWMVYAVVVGALLGGAALITDVLLRARGLPCRWMWAMAMAAALAVPVVSLARPSAPAAIVPTDAATAPVADAPHAWLAAVEAGADRLGTLLAAAEPHLLPAWLVGSLLLTLVLAGGLLQLRARARAWPTRRVAGTEVLVSEGFGPAVLGLRRTRIVVPRWLLELDHDRRCLAVWHEDEHRSAHDAQLLFAGVVAILLAPWNPVLWWQLRRLRAAVELDCDARVLRRGARRALYGSLLLEVGTGATRLPISVAALSAPPSLLERRLIMIGRGTKKHGMLATGMLSAAAVLAVAMACETAPPIEPTMDGGRIGTNAPQERGGAERLIQEIRDGEGRPARIVRALPEGAPRALGDGEAPIIYIDGIRVRNSDALADLVEPDAIERIEVIKGGAAEALFGSEAADGVIQIFLKRAGEQRGTPR